MSTQNTHTKTAGSVAPLAVAVCSAYGLCRDCKHWLFSRREQLVEYPREQPLSEGYLDGVCPKLHRTLTITATGGWDGATVDSVETDANFGCVLFEPNNGEVSQDAPR